MTDRELMQMALDELEKEEHEYFSYQEVIKALRERLAQPEPVDETAKDRHELAGTIPISNGGIATRTPSSFISPPQREWVGLSDKEVTSIIREWHWMPYELCKVIEAKLKEKNILELNNERTN